MKRFVLKIGLFLTGLNLLLIAVGSTADRIAPLNVWRDKAESDFDTFSKRKGELQALSLGNSHSGAIDFTAMGVEGQVLARAGTDLFEVSRYANSVVDKTPAMETAFFAISYFSFSRDNLILDDTRIIRIELYAMLPDWRPISGDGSNLLLGKVHAISRIMSVARPDSWRKVIDQVRAPPLDTEPSPTTEVTSSTSWGICPHMSFAELEAHGTEIATKTATRHQGMARINPQLENETRAALGSAIGRLQDNGVRVILFTPPYYHSYNERFNNRAPELVVHMYQAVEKLQQRYQVEYYDFSDVPGLTSRPELFLNSDHVNDCGRRAFSEKLTMAMKLNSRLPEVN